MSEKELTIHEALCELQYAIGTIQKNQEVNVGKFKFKYADLAGIREAIREPLHKWGFSISQIMEDGVLITILYHKSGESIRSSVKIPPAPDLKALGGSLTYLRRYSLASILNLVSDEDLDVLPEEIARTNSSRRLVSQDQLKVLHEELHECGEEYTNKVLGSLKSAYQIVDLKEMTQELYNRVLKAAREYREKQ